MDYGIRQRYKDCAKYSFKKVGGNGKQMSHLQKVTACGAGGGRGYNSMPGGTGSYVENQALNTTTAASNIYLAVGEGGKSGSKTSGSINNNYGGAGAVVPGVPVATAFLAAVMLIVEAMQVAVRVYQQSGVEMEEAAVRVIIIIMVAQAARVQGVANT